MNKYRNVKVGNYASRREAKRAQELKLLERAGEITELREQVEFVLIPPQYIDGKCVERACKAILDFTYREKGVLVGEDAKGFKTPVWRLKRKLMLSVHQLRVRET